jgi:N6-L-threonylcarbamoyladenine synthase
VKFKKVHSILLSGGVAANGKLRRYFRNMARKEGLSFYSPGKLLCLDNAAMVAGLGYHHYRRKNFAPLSVEVEPNIRIRHGKDKA